MVDELKSRFWNRLRRKRAERELDEELRFHAEQLAEDYVRAGLSPQEARRRALVELGGIEQTKEECRDALGIRLLRDLGRDLRYGLRQLGRAPGFTLACVLTLALGIGLNSAMFSALDVVVLRPLPYPAAGRLVTICEQRASGTQSVVSPAEYQRWRDQAKSLDAVTTVQRLKLTISSDGAEPETASGQGVNADFFPMLGLVPLLGRTFSREQEEAGAEPVVVLGWGLWQRRFGGDRSVLGRKIAVDGVSRSVIGVMGPQAVFDEAADMWLPRRLPQGPRAWTAGHYLHVYGRLRPGVTLGQARAELNHLAGQMEAEHPESNTGHHPAVFNLADDWLGPGRNAAWMLMGVAAFVLLIGCVNVANLMLARGSARQREFAVRAALGAGRARLIRQSLAEALLLSLAGGALGLLFGRWLVHILDPAGRPFLPASVHVAIDWRCFLFTLAVSLTTGVVSSLLPALRSSAVRCGEALKQSSSAVLSGGNRRAMHVLVAGEVALAMLLLVGGGLLLRSLSHLTNVDPGFAPQGLLALEVRVSKDRTSTGEANRAFFTGLIERLSSLPGVAASATVDTLPMSGSSNSNTITVEGRPAASLGQRPSAGQLTVSPGYFGAMKIPLLRGRGFAETEASGAGEGIVVVNQTLARRFFGSTDPIGKRIRWGGPEDKSAWLTIVGVCGDVRHYGLLYGVRPEVYSPPGWFAFSSMWVVVRAAGDAAAVAPAVRRELRQSNPEQPVPEIHLMSEFLGRSLEESRILAILFGGFAALALLLASLGIYGVMAYSVSERTREIGIRMALGARRTRVVSEIARQAASLIGVGVVIGLAGSLAVTRLLVNMLYGVEPGDPAVLAAVALVLGGVGLAAALIPARRAARLDPAVTLRFE